MRFEFATSNRIVFGPGVLDEVGALARAFGHRPLVVTGHDPARATRLIERLMGSGLAATSCSIAHEPTTDDITRAVALARESNCDHVIGYGGGAALDAAKAVAALSTNRGDLFDYLEVIGRARALEQPGLPCIAIPTTAGTGSEVTRNAVLASTTHRVKVSLRSAHMLPRLALVDPTLTYSLPPHVTATTGLDALTQLIEPYTSARANPMTDALCVDGIRRAARSLRHAVENGSDAAAREDMALASLFGGLALANAGLGAVHGFAGPIGGMFPAPHGAVCAALLPLVMDANLTALRVREPRHPALARYDEVARLLTGDAHAVAADGVRWVSTLVMDLAIPALRTHGITRTDFGAIVEASAKASSMKANPIVLNAGEMNGVLERAW
jgi:alcohol dehydrogenase class IV